MSTSDLPLSHRLLTVPEAMEALQLGRHSIYNLLRSRELPSIKIGRARRIPADALQAFIAERTSETYQRT